MLPEMRGMHGRICPSQPWENLLPDLMAAAAEESPVSLVGKQRALTALKYVLQALKGAIGAS